MKNILEFKQIIEQELKEIEIPNRPENLYQPINYILSLDAKRIRAIALLMAHQLYNDDYKNAGFHLLPSSNGKDLKSAFLDIEFVL